MHTAGLTRTLWSGIIFILNTTIHLGLKKSVHCTYGEGRPQKNQVTIHDKAKLGLDG